MSLVEGNIILLNYERQHLQRGINDKIVINTLIIKKKIEPNTSMMIVYESPFIDFHFYCQTTGEVTFPTCSCTQYVNF